MSDVKHRVFISYHHEDQTEVEAFVQTFSDERNVFSYRAVGVMSDDIINSANSEYVMSQIRKNYLKDSTVTIVLIGKCTWARKYVDWEIKTSLRQGQYTPNGLLGILLPSMGDTANPPQRLRDNLKMNEQDDEAYARWYTYPTSKDSLRKWIEDAFQARTTRADLIHNSQDMFKNNRSCS